METIYQVLQILSSREIIDIVALSLRVSGLALILGSFIGVPLGAAIGLSSFRGKLVVETVVNSLMGLPPVFVGLVTYLILSRNGPLGPLNLLFTPEAMILAQLVLILPIIVGMVSSAIESVEPGVKELAVSLGADTRQLALKLIREARFALITSLVVAFGAALSEVGAILIVGGNIRFLTMTLTTGIVRSVELGDFTLALVLGVILLVISFVVNLPLAHIRRRFLK